MSCKQEEGFSENLKKKKLYKSKYLIFITLLLVVLGISGISIAETLVGDNQITGLNVTPDPIRLGSTAYIQYTLGQNGYVFINVYKENGEHVKTLLNNILKNAGSQTQSWDGKDITGKLVPDGNYRFLVEARNSTGGLIGQAEKTVLAARTPGISLVNDAPDPFNPLNGDQAAINYTLSSDAIVTVTILKGSTPVRTVVASEFKSAGANSAVWDGKDINNVIAGDATYTYQIDAVNPLVPTFKSTYRSTTVLEKEAPQVTDFTVTPDPFKITSATMTVRYTLSENATVTARIYDSTGNVVQTLLNGAAKNAGYNSLTWDGKDSGGNYITEGIYSVVINAVDNYGKSSGNQSRSFAAGYQPIISNADISPNPYNPTDLANNTATISFEIYREDLVTVEILSGSVPVRTIIASQTAAAGVKTVTWDGKDDAGNLVVDGTYYFQITAVSPTVNTFKTIYKNSFSNDKGAPIVTELTTTPDPYKLGIGTPLTIRYNLSEDATVSIDIYNGDNIIRTLAVNQAKKIGSNLATWDGKDNSNNPVGEGNYKVVVKAVDPFNQKGEATVTVAAGFLPTISNAGNTPGIFNPTVDMNTNVYFDISNDASVTVTILKGYTPVRTILANVLKSAGTVTVNWDGKDDSSQPVSDGSYTYQIDAASPTVASFKSTNKGDIIVEANNPAFTDISISPSVAKIGTNATFRYTLSEPATITAQVVNFTGQVVRDFSAETKVSGGFYSMVWDTRDNSGNLVTTGNYTLKINATDNFSKTGTAEFAFQVGEVPVISNAVAVPQSFNPAAGNKTTISYNLSQRSYATVKIYDTNNAIWKTLYHSKDVTGSDSVSWDGKNDKGQIVNGTYIFKIDATSVVGSFRAQQVSETVYVSGDVITPPNPSTCTGCHLNYPASHPIANCAGCHSNDVPIQDCASCHPNWSHDGNILTKYECSYCHDPKYSYKIPSHPADINSIHVASLASDCQKCHLATLNIEHPKHKNAVTNLPLDCNTCHQSTVAKVVYAIANKQKNCDACHANSGHESMHTPTGIQTDCTKCHIDSLTQEHLNNPKTQTDPVTGKPKPWTCDTCHASSNTTVQQAIYNKDRNCSTCHTQANHEAVHTTMVLDANCTTCHINSLTQEHLNNPKTQTDPVTGKPKPWTCDTCHNSTNPIVAGAVYTDNKQCAACHRQGHNMNLTETTDIPLYAGLSWTTPIDALIWAGESWMPDEFVNGGKVLISNRSNAANFTGDNVWQFYQAQMPAKGWTLTSDAPAAGADFFKVTFTNGTHKALIWFYGGENHNASPVLASGYRIEIIYK